MPFLRLSAPIYPSMLLWTTDGLSPWTGLKKLTQIVLIGAAPWLPLHAAWAQRADLGAVVQRRWGWVRNLAPVCDPGSVVAAVDVGWVGLACPAHILDLGGVTDPRLARLPGGHTHRVVGAGLFADRNVDIWVIRAADRSYEPQQPLSVIVPVYGTDARLLAQSKNLGFEGVLTFPIEGTSGQYVVARLAPRD
jgi:hypothetical protein